MQDDSDRVRLLCDQLTVRVQGHSIPCGRGNTDIQRFISGQCGGHLGDHDCWRIYTE